jgi:sporulation protein YunB
MNKIKIDNKLMRRRRVVFLCVAIAVIVFILMHFQKNVTTVILSISEASVKSIATVAINEAVYYTLNDALNYEDIITIHKDDYGKISAITTNSIKINEIARDTAYLSQQNLKRIGESGIKVPIGALTGSAALAGFGPKITIKIIPIGNVLCQFISEFKEAGINQTTHRIYLEIIADISIITPTATTSIASKTEVLICENLLVGEVPDTFLNANLFSNGYKLVP